MPHKHTTKQPLLDSIDKIIDKYGQDNPELLEGLTKLRDEAREAYKKRRREDFALAALKLATWIKFIFDNLPPTQ